uniref:Cytochrome c oxidase subunit 7C, mitochondrial n=1 Tax=Amblyomma tuberculatum TaxID=48802 RepID=A0A6M2E0X0_9ACAR
MSVSRITRLAASARNFTTSAIRRSGHDDHDTSGIPGSNLPFKIDNKYGLTIKFALFFGSAFAVPFFAIRHQLLKQ